MQKKILVVDDSQIQLDISGFVLTEAGYQVFMALGGNEAIELLSQQKIDLIMVDINMPGMDGYTLTSTIRLDSQFETLPIIILTTEAEAGDKKKGLDAGADVYLVKPIIPGELLAHVQLLIGEP